MLVIHAAPTVEAGLLQMIFSLIAQFSLGARLWNRTWDLLGETMGRAWGSQELWSILLASRKDIWILNRDVSRGTTESICRIRCPPLMLAYYPLPRIWTVAHKNSKVTPGATHKFCKPQSPASPSSTESSGTSQQRGGRARTNPPTTLHSILGAAT